MVESNKKNLQTSYTHRGGASSENRTNKRSQ